MSNVPSGFWPPPPPYADQGGPAGALGNPAASVGWRIRNSLWLLLPVLGCSCLGGVGFLYVGLRTRRPAWWIPGIVYTVVGWSAFILVGETDTDSAASDWGLGGVLAVWIGSILHAALINSSWLRWRANYRPWYAQPTSGHSWTGGTYPAGPLAPPPAMPVSGPAPVSPPYGPPYPAPDPTAVLTPPPSTYYGPGPVATPMPQPVAGVTAEASSTIPPLPSAAVDVNSTGLAQLAALPGFDAARAQHVLARREARGGFGSVAEFAAEANLAPHEYARLRAVLTCAPPATPGPHTGGQQPQGRVVDV